MTPTQRGIDAAKQVANAYMTDCYGEEWTKIGGWLARQGLSNMEIEAVLRSKYMRWAGDINGGKHTLRGFKKFWLQCPGMVTRKAIEELTRETFGANR